MDTLFEWCLKLGVFIAAIAVVAAVLRRILNFNRLTELNEHAPAGDKPIEKDDDWIQGLPESLHTPGARQWRIFNVFRIAADTETLRVFDFHRRFTDADGDSVREYGTACCVEMKHSANVEFIVTRVSLKNSVLIESREDSQRLPGGYTLYKRAGTTVPEEFLIDLTSVVTRHSDVRLLEVSPDAVMIQSRSRPWGRGIPKSPREWFRRAFQVLIYSREYADPVTFWELPEATQELARLVREHFGGSTSVRP